MSSIDSSSKSSTQSASGASSEAAALPGAASLPGAAAPPRAAARPSRTRAPNKGVVQVEGREPDFELECEIRIALPDLHAFLCDLHRYVPLHPFIESIQDLPPTEALPRARRYRVVDRIPLGPFKLKTVYTAALDPVTPDEVHGHAWQSPGVRLRSVYSLARTAEGTRLTERCFVEARPLMRGFVVSQARKAHTKTQEEMKELLENETPRLA